MRQPIKNVITQRIYDINYLADIWENKGWQGLASLARMLNIRIFGFGYKDDCSTHKIKHALEGTYEHLLDDANATGPFFELRQTFRWYILILAPPNKKLPRSLNKQLDYIPYDRGHEGSAADDAKLLKCYEKIAVALADSKTLGEAFRKTVAPEMLNAYLKSLPKNFNERAEIFFRIRIKNMYSEAFQNIARWTRKQASHKEVWWNCVWLYIRDDVEEMLQIQDHILKDVPLTEEQFQLINEYMGYGNPRGILLENEDGSYKYEICLDVQNCQFLPYRDIVNVGCGLLTQPAFALGQQYFKNWSSPRFIKTCRAPSCGKSFHTKRSKATACPSKCSDRKSNCALEWIRYKRYLLKISQNPERDWNNEKFQKDFISYDKE